MKIYLYILFLLLSYVANGQPATLDRDQQRLLLQFGGAFMNVLSETRIDMDSGVLIAARAARIGRSPVIAEGIDPGFLAQYGGWIDRDDIAAGKKALLQGAKPTGQSANSAGQAFLIGAYYAFQPEWDGKASDSALLYLKKAQASPEWRRPALILTEKVYFDSRDTTNGLASLHEAIAECRRAGDKAGEARAWNYEATFYPFVMDVLPRRLEALEKALPLYRQLKDTANQCVCLSYKGFMNVAAKNVAVAKAADSEALRLEQAYRFPYLHYSEDQLIYISIITDTRRETLDQTLLALQQAETLKDSLLIPGLEGRVGQVYLAAADKYGKWSVGWITKASDHLERAIRLHEERHQRAEIYTILNMLLAALQTQKRYKEAVFWSERVKQEFPPDNPIEEQELALAEARSYERLHDTALADKYFMDVLRLEPLTQKIRGDLMEATMYYYVGEFYFGIRRYGRARPYLIKYLNAPSNKNLSLDYMAGAYERLSIIDSSAGDYASAFRWLNLYSKYADSITHLNEIRRIDSVQTGFATAQKERDNALLRTQNLSQRQALAHASLVRSIIFGGLVLLLIVIALLVNRYRIKHRANQQLAAQKQEIDDKNRELAKLLASKEWLLREINHRVKNNLRIMTDLLSMQADSMESDEATEAIRDSEKRLHAISLIHQKLSQTSEKELIGLDSFIRDFVHAMHDNFYQDSPIRLELQLTPLDLDITQAVPLALILNEAVTNVYKYAFESPAPPQLSNDSHLMDVTPILRITLLPVEAGKYEVEAGKYEVEKKMYELRIADNGKGLPETMPGKGLPEATPTRGSLGIRLMQGLASQIHAKFSIESKGGVIIAVRFT